MSTTGSNRGSKVVHLATAVPFTWKGETTTAYDRACNTNKAGAVVRYLDDKTIGDAEVTCPRCRKMV